MTDGPFTGELAHLDRKERAELMQACDFSRALRNPVEHALCFLSSGLQGVLGALGRAVSRVTGG